MTFVRKFTTAAVVIGFAMAALAQRRYFDEFGYRGREPAIRNVPYDGQFTFVRVRYESLLLRMGGCAWVTHQDRGGGRVSCAVHEPRARSLNPPRTRGTTLPTPAPPPPAGPPSRSARRGRTMTELAQAHK